MGREGGKKARKEQVQEKQMKDVDQGVTSECSNSDDSFSESENESISQLIQFLSGGLKEMCTLLQKLRSSCKKQKG